jgi:hypothetical protein
LSHRRGTFTVRLALTFLALIDQVHLIDVKIYFEVYWPEIVREFCVFRGLWPFDSGFFGICFSLLEVLDLLSDIRGARPFINVALTDWLNF